MINQDVIEKFRAMPEQERESFRRRWPDWSEEVEIADLRQRAWDSFWVFTSEVRHNPVLQESLHKPIADWAEDWAETEKKLLLLPRGHIKSNLITIDYVLWRLWKNPNIRILIRSHKDPDACKFLRGIKDAILDDPVFGKVCPEIKPAMDGPRRKLWNESQIIVQRDGQFIDPTVEAIGDGETTGRHFDLIIMDDIVTRASVTSPELILKTREMRELSESLLDPGGQTFIVGTRYDFGDEYGYILEDPDLKSAYETKVMPCVSDVEAFHEFVDGRREWKRQDDYEYLLYPKRFTLASKDHKDSDGDPFKARKSLVSTYKHQGSLTFANQYLLEPFDPTRAKIPVDFIEEVDGFPLDPDGVPVELEWGRCCDLSSDTPTGYSYTVIITAAMTKRCDLYITNIWRGDYDGSQTIDELIRGQRVDSACRPRVIGMEPGPYERQLKPFLERRSRETVWIPFKFVPANEHNKNKDERIRGMEPWIRARKVKILRTCANKEVLFREGRQFPKGTTKDVLDALAKFPIIMYPQGAEGFLDDPVIPEPEQKPIGMTIDKALHGMRMRSANAIGNDRVTKRPGVELARF